MDRSSSESFMRFESLTTMHHSPSWSYAKQLIQLAKKKFTTIRSDSFRLGFEGACVTTMGDECGENLTLKFGSFIRLHHFYHRRNRRLQTRHNRRDGPTAIAAVPTILHHLPNTVGKAKIQAALGPVGSSARHHLQDYPFVTVPFERE